MRKDGGGGGGGEGAGATTTTKSMAFPWLQVKPYVPTLVFITLVIAVWQLQPSYESLISTHLSTPCPILPTNNTHATTTTTTTNLITTIPKQKISSSSSLASTAAPSTLRKPVTTLPDPNKRVFRPYGSAAALFVQMGAYRGGPATFSIVGLASKPTHVFGKPWFKCEWVPNDHSRPNVRAKAYKMLPDWGYGRVYTVVVVNCTFPSNPNPDNSGGKLLLYAYYSPSPRRFEKFVALEEAPGAFNDSRYRPPFQYDYLYCGSSLYGNLSASRIREWMAYHAYFFGPRSHFVFHDAGGVSPEVRAVLEPWVKAGRATLQDIRAQADYDGYYYNQFLVVNDCLHRYRHAANWTFYFDVDEYIYVPGNNTLQLVLEELSPYTQFTIEQNPMSSALCVLDPHTNHSREWGFEKLVFRNMITGVRRDRKYAIQARNAYATGVHMSENVIGPTTHKTESKIRYYHYHNSINIVGEPCRKFVPLPPSRGQGKSNVTWFEKVPYVYDDSLKQMADTIKRFEQQAIGHFRV